MRIAAIAVISSGALTDTFEQRIKKEQFAVSNSVARVRLHAALAVLLAALLMVANAGCGESSSEEAGSAALRDRAEFEQEEEALEAGAESEESRQLLQEEEAAVEQAEDEREAAESGAEEEREEAKAEEEQSKSEREERDSHSEYGYGN